MSEPSKSPSEGRRSEALLGPLTVRDLTLFGGVVITFVASLLPLFDRFLFANLWNASNLFFLAIGILGPLAAAGLFAWRRVSPKQRLRIGSFSVDQFASVVSVLSAAFYFVLLVTTLSVGALVGLLGGLAMLAATTLARFVPPFAVDFEGRAEIPAHVMARDAVPAVPRSKPAAGAAARADRSEEGGASKQGGDLVGADSAAGTAGAAGAAGAVGAAAVAGAAASSAWAGHQDDNVWFEPASGSAPGPRQPTDPAAAEVPSADDVAPTDTAGPAEAEATAEPRDVPAAAAEGPGSGPSGAPAADDAPDSVGVGAADLLTPREELDARGVGGLGVVSAGDSAALEATEAHVAGKAAEERTPSSASGPSISPEPADAALMDHFGEADGEMYGAPEPVAPVVGRAEAEKPGPREDAAGPATAVFPASTGGRASREDIGATKPYEEPEPYEAFWFAVSERRTAVDPSTGQPVFELQPGQWILALQDRGREFVVQSTDGRIGVLRELAGIERA